MSKDIKKVPQLRFPGFEGEWEEKRFSDVLKSHPFRQYLATPEENGKYVVIQQGDNPEVGLANGNPFINFEDVTLFGDHTVSLYRPREPFFIATDGVKIISADNFEGNYLYALLERYMPKSQGYKRHFSILKEQKIYVTKNPDEQRQIGKMFEDMNKQIKLHSKKIKVLYKLKESISNKIFPQNGSNIPEIRFPEFSGEWSMKKLSDVASVESGGTPSTNVQEYWNGDIDWYSPVEIGNEIYVSASRKKITELGLKKSSAKILPKGTVLFTSRAGIGNTAILEKEGCTNQGFQSIVPHKALLDSYFIFSRTTELKKYGEIYGAGSTFVEVSGKQLSEMNLFIPNIKEQQKIGEFFQQLDILITLHKRKLEHLELQKKALLQQLFV